MNLRSSEIITSPPIGYDTGISMKINENLGYGV